MVFIGITAIIIYFIFIAWTWQSLGEVEKTKKVAFIVIGFIILYIITLIIFLISKSGISYPNEQMQSDIKNMLVIIFTGVNGIILLPQIGKIIDKINEDEIEKDAIKKRAIILLVIFIICLIFESGYIKDIQEGILAIYNSKK